MGAAGLAILAALAAAPPDPGGRIAESAAAAEALQGGLDGAWRLESAGGQTLFVFQIADPADGSGPQGAWRAGRGDGVGPLARVRRAGGSLWLEFDAGGGMTRVVLRRAGRSRWKGRISGPLGDLAVTLRPVARLAGAWPPV